MMQRIKELEQHYRVCACRSTTPFFSDRKNHYDLGHKNDKEGNPYRTYFQHDRDKILYSPSFRKLRLKTQIFPEHTSDYLRTRLDHTLEVAQIARHIARQLKLNEDLVDAIALAHDIGHTPFGHSGERALHRYLTKRKCDGFKHNWQGLRVVDKIEKFYPEIDGLNLTNAVRIGILKHTSLHYKKLKDQPCSCDMYKDVKKEFGEELADSGIDIFEVQVVQVADEFAQAVHDFEDAVISNSISLENFVRHQNEYPLLNECVQIVKKGVDIDQIDYENKESTAYLIARIRSEMIYQLTLDLVCTSRTNLDEWEKCLNLEDKPKGIEKFNDFIIKQRNEKPSEGFPPLIVLNEKKTLFEKFKKILEKKIIHSERINRMDGKADYIIRNILEVYLDSPKQIPHSVLNKYNKEVRFLSDDELKEKVKDLNFLRVIIDYVAGMTDRFALREYDQLYAAYPRNEL